MATWRIETTGHTKFPYRILIIEGCTETLSLVAQDKWPGQKGNIFCLRGHEDIDEHGDIIEECAVVSLRRYGRKLSILLDRANKKRCEFLFLEKSYKNKEGTYEQIFFRTQTGVKQHRSKGRLNLYGTDENLEIVIDSNERYPWNFGHHTVNRQSLGVGDYALRQANTLTAIVERKTFDNMLSDISHIQILHQQLAELSLYPQAALVIEAQYADFLDSKKIKKWSMAHMARVFAELSALHPTLPIIYAGNRKTANIWTLRYFEAVAKQATDKTIAPIAKAVSKSRTTGKANDPIWLQVDKAVQEMPVEFKTADVVNQCQTLSANQVRVQLIKLKENGKLTQQGVGRGLVWQKVPNDELPPPSLAG